MQSFTNPFASFVVPQEQLQAIQDKFIKNWQNVQEQAMQGTLQAPADRRFKDTAWQSDANYLLMAHYYHLTSKAMHEMVNASNLDEHAKEQLSFSVMQWLEAISPTNFFFTNPVAQQEAIKTHGQSVAKGMQLLFSDLQKGRLTQTDENAFTVGENLAITPGQVVYQNPLMQLIQYKPSTPNVYQLPLLIVPPCINKYYILDLQAKNSFVKHAVENGFTVFLISWRNPLTTDNDNIDKASWGDYIKYGISDALHVIRKVTGVPQCNALGFCVGGTLLASALAIEHAKGRRPVNALTLLTSFLDFSDTGVMNVFVNNAHATSRDQQFKNGGLMSANELATTFSFLRPGELVWNYVSSGYLMGQSPRAFDLLYWNSDGTNLPGPFFAWYFRNTYLENNLVKGKVSIDGYKVDLSSLNMPAYVYASREDHIVPWQSAFKSTKILSGNNRFVLGASGHIAGVINPPEQNRRSYWVNNNFDYTASESSSESWLDTATENQGSWWPDWIQWLSGHSGNKVAAPQSLGSEAFKPIEPAPGSYVKTRAV